MKTKRALLIFAAAQAFGNHCNRLLDKNFDRGNGFTYVHYTKDAGRTWQPLDYYRQRFVRDEGQKRKLKASRLVGQATSAQVVPSDMEAEAAGLITADGEASDEAEGQEAARDTRAGDAAEARSEGSAAGGAQEAEDDAGSGAAACAPGAGEGSRKRTKQGGAVSGVVTDVTDVTDEAEPRGSSSSRGAGCTRPLRDRRRAESSYSAGELVEARFMRRSAAWYPADVVAAPARGLPLSSRNISGSSAAQVAGLYVLRYHHKPFGERVVAAADIRPCDDFEWCRARRRLGALPGLGVGDRVEGRFCHAQGNKVWYLGRVVRVQPDGSCSIQFDDGDFESGVRRENVRHVGGESTGGGGGGGVVRAGGGNQGRGRKRRKREIQQEHEGRKPSSAPSRGLSGIYIVYWPIRLLHMCAGCVCVRARGSDRAHD
jgi:hypothetical protein